MKNNWRRRQTRRLALLLAAVLTLSTVTVHAEEEPGKDLGELDVAAMAEIPEDSGEETEAEETVVTRIEAETQEAIEESAGDLPEDSSPVVSPTEEEVVSTESTEEDWDPDRDYILGRPMTEWEIQLQQACEPDSLLMDPKLGLVRAEEVDLSDVEFDGHLADPNNLPESFDARKYGLITSVKDQHPYGTCWAFAAISNGETSVIRNKLSVGTKDLSEHQLAYFFYHGDTDPLGNTAGDSTRVGSGMDYLEIGGHGIFTTFCLANWVGLVKESDAPYSAVKANRYLTLSPELERSKDVAHMQNAYWVDMTDVPAVKLLARKFGNVCASIYFDNYYYDYDTGGYYNMDVTSTNHMINIVGWDDTYRKENFSQDPAMQPQSDGAWLAKNIWGDSWGDQGYFWISYEDASFTGNAAFGYVYDFERASNYTNQYQYDGSYSFGTRKVSSGSSVANVYTVSGSEAELLKAVSLATISAGVEYSIQIYKNPDKGDPTSGTPLLDTPQTGKISYAGYATIPLEQADLVLHRGDTFSVVYTLTHDGSITLPVDKSGQNGGVIIFQNQTEPGQSYYASKGVWTDLGMTTTGEAKGNSGETFRIKAFTTNVSSLSGDESDDEPDKMILSDSLVSLNAGDSFTLAVQNAQESEEDITWTSSDPKVATVRDGIVKALATGTAVIRVSRGNASAECTVEVGLKDLTLDDALGYAWRKIKLSWTPVPGAEGYFVYRKDEEGEWQQIAKVKGQAKYYYIASVDSSDESYTYTACAYSNHSGELLMSEYDHQGLTARAIPNMPTLKTTSSASNGVKLTWNKVRCDGYKIYRRLDEGPWQCVKTVPGSTKYYCTDKKAIKGRTYEYSIRAYFRSGSKYAYSEQDPANLVGKRIPKQPTLKKAVSVTSGVKITWGKVSCHGYRIYRKMPNGTWEQLGTASKRAASYIDKTAEVGVPYTYTVCSYYTRDEKYVLSSYKEEGITGTRK